MVTSLELSLLNNAQPAFQKRSLFPPFTAVFGRGLISACALAYKWGKVGYETVGRLLYSKQPHIRTYDLGFQADQVLIHWVLSEKSS